MMNIMKTNARYVNNFFQYSVLRFKGNVNSSRVKTTLCMCLIHYPSTKFVDF